MKRIIGFALGLMVAANAQAVILNFPVAGMAFQNPAAVAITGGTGGFTTAYVIAAATGFTGGTVTPQFQLTNTGTTAMGLARFTSSASNPATFIFGKSKGTTVGSYTVSATNDQIGSLQWQASDGTHLVNGATLDALVDATPSTGIVQARVRLRTSPASGTLTTAYYTDSSQRTIFGGASGGTDATAPDATLVIVDPDATTAGLRLRSSRSAIVSTNVVGGIDFQSNDTTLTAPGTVVGALQFVANETHTATALGTDVIAKCTLATTTTFAECFRVTAAGVLSLAGVAQKFPKTFTTTYDPASLAAATARCDDVTVTGITTTGGAVAANIGNTDPATGCVVATVRAKAADTVRVCWMNTFDAVTACDTASSTWTFTQAQ